MKRYEFTQIAEIYGQDAGVDYNLLNIFIEEYKPWAKEYETPLQVERELAEWYSQKLDAQEGSQNANTIT